MFETDTTIEVWSRAGGCLRLSKANGSQIGRGHFELEGSLSSVYGTSSSRLLLLNDGRCCLYHGGEKVADLSTQGPIQHALYLEESTWILSGWREEILLEESSVKNHKQDEVVVQHIMNDEQLWLLTNDGMLHHSILTE